MGPTTSPESCDASEQMMAVTSAVTERVRVHAEPTRAEWNAYVSRHPHATPYHDAGWLSLIERAFGHQTRYLAAENVSGICGVLPLVLFKSRMFGRFAVSMPFVNYGGILADCESAARALLDRAIEETRAIGGTHLELRHTSQMFAHLASKRHKVAMELRLEPTVERQWQGLDRKLRNQIRKGEKSNLHVEYGGIELLSAFYAVFAHNMRDLGTPVYDAGFFREVLTTFPQQTRIVCVRLEGRPVAASILHWREQRIEVPWASSLRAFNPLCANVLLYWKMLQFSIEHGFTTFDFGRSTPGEGTFLFKQQWGAAPRELVWEYWTEEGHLVPNLNPKNPKFDAAIRVWQRLPVSVATTLGPRIVRNIP